MSISLSDPLAFPKGANIAYKRQHWVLKSWQTVLDFPEPMYYNEAGELLMDVIYIPHLITLIEEK